MRKPRKDKGVAHDRWTVYNNETDMPVMIDGTAAECAKAMGLTTVNSFYQAKYKASHGIRDKWYIEKVTDDEVIE